MSPEEIDKAADAIAAWEDAVGWTAPEEGIPGSGIPPFRLQGASWEWLNGLIDESPDVRATRVPIRGVWMQIYSGHHPEHGNFTVLMKESECQEGSYGFCDHDYIVHDGCLYADNINFGVMAALAK